MLATINRNHSVHTLSKDEIMRRAPSVFSDRPSDKVSSRYLFVPTSKVLEELEREGFGVVKAMQSRSRTPDGVMFMKHCLRLRHRSTLEKSMREFKDSIPEIVLTNSHNGASTYQITLGCYRLVCSNGLMVGSTWAEERVRHTGDDVSKVIEASYRILGQEKQLVAAMDSFRGIELSEDERRIFANAAIGLKWTPERRPTAQAMLTARRYADTGRDLWTTFNVVQENMIKGGVVISGANLRRSSARSVQSVSEDKRLNQGLWTLAEEMYNLKTKAA